MLLTSDRQIVSDTSICLIEFCHFDFDIIPIQGNTSPVASRHADRIIIQYLLQEFVSIHGDELGGFVLMFQSILHTACALPSVGIEQGTWKITSGRTSLLPGPSR